MQKKNQPAEGTYREGPPRPAPRARGRPRPPAGLAPAKRDEAKRIVKDFQTGIRGADRPAQAKDRTAVIEAYKATAALLDGFLDLTSDVPAEL